MLRVARVMCQPPELVRRWSDEDILGVVVDMQWEAEASQRRTGGGGAQGPVTSKVTFRVRPKSANEKRGK